MSKRFPLVFRLAAVLGLLSAAATVTAGDRVEVLGFSPAYLDTAEGPTVPVPRLNVMDERMLALTLRVEVDGSVTDVQAEDPQDSTLAAKLRDWLMGWHGEPACRDGQAATSLLPVHVHLYPSDATPELIAPLDTGGVVASTDLLGRSLALNGISLPTVIEFPSYFAVDEPQLGDEIYPIVLLRLTLDSTGRPLRSEEVLTTSASFGRLVQAASRWGRYAPARVEGKTRLASVFLLVSLFPDLSYPSQPWRSTEAATYGALDRMRVRILPDTTGFVCGPLPRWSPSDRYSLGGEIVRPGVVAAWIRFDTLGTPQLMRTSKTGSAVRDAVRRLIASLRFHPAVAIDGTPRRFSGLMYLEFQSSTIVRIRCAWLP